MDVIGYALASQIRVRNDRWVSRLSSDNAQRQYLAAASADGMVYTFGGERPDGVQLNDHYAYDPVLNTFTAKANYPSSMSRLAGASANGMVYGIGGRSGSGIFAVVYEYDPSANTWLQKAARPQNAYDLAAASLNGKIYAIGGYNAGHLNQNYEFDPSANAWTSRAPMPTARSGLGVAACNGKIYAFGGDSGAHESYLLVNEEYDPASNSWVSRASMRESRKYFAYASLNEKAYVICGEYKYVTPGNNISTPPLRDVEEYDPTVNTWYGRTHTIWRRAGCASAEAHGKLYLFGGRELAFNVDNYLRSIEEYSPIGVDGVDDLLAWLAIV